MERLQERQRSQTPNDAATRALGCVPRAPGAIPGARTSPSRGA